MSKKKSSNKKKGGTVKSATDEILALSLEDDDGSISREDLVNINRLIGLTTKSFSKVGTELLETFKRRCTLTVGFTLMDCYENMLAPVDTSRRIQTMYLIYRVRELDAPLKKKFSPSMLGHPFTTFFISVFGGPNSLSSPYCDFTPSPHERLLALILMRPQDAIGQLSSWIDMSAETFVDVDYTAFNHRLLEELSGEASVYYNLQLISFPQSGDQDACPAWITVPSAEKENSPSDVVSAISSIYSHPSASMTGMPPTFMPVMPGFMPIQDIEMCDFLEKHLREPEEEEPSGYIIPGIEEIRTPSPTLPLPPIGDPNLILKPLSELTDEEIHNVLPLAAAVNDAVANRAASNFGLSISIPDSPTRGRLSQASPSVSAENITSERVEELVTRVIEGYVLSQLESRQLVAVISNTLPQHYEGLERLKTIPLTYLPQLIEENSKIAGDVLSYHLKTNPDIIHSFISLLMTMEMSVQCLEVVHKMYKLVPTLDRDPLVTYIRHLIRICSEVARPAALQARLVRILCFLIASLLKEKLISPESIETEANALCIQFSAHQATSTLFQYLRQMETME